MANEPKSGEHASAPPPDAPKDAGDSEANAAALPVPKHVFPTPGEVITTDVFKNTFTIGEVIGEGAFGVVYACKDQWNNDLAVKVLKPLGTYDKVKTAATAEFLKLMVLRHPNITFVHDAFEYRHTFYIVTERCSFTVANLFKLKDFNGLWWLKPIARGLLQAVHFLHINSHAHQDIHPGNIFLAMVKDEMVADSPEVMKLKLGDLGVARVFSELDGANTRAQWMLPPEVRNTAEFGPLDHRIDIYHVGLLLLQLASSKEMRFTSEEILSGKPREMALTLPAPYNFAIEKALRRHAQFRTASAMELWRDLNSPVTSG